MRKKDFRKILGKKNLARVTLISSSSWKFLFELEI